MGYRDTYFNKNDAYDNNNSVYVLDDYGSKLFNSNQVELIKGHNVFSVLKKMLRSAFPFMMYLCICMKWQRCI